MTPNFSLRSLLIVVTAICATLSQSPTIPRYTPFIQGTHEYKDRRWLPDGSAVAERRIRNPTFLMPGVALGMWFWCGYVVRKSRGDVRTSEEDQENATRVL